MMTRLPLSSMVERLYTPKEIVEMYRFFLEIPLKIYNYTAFQLKFYKFYPFHLILTTLQQSSR